MKRGAGSEWSGRLAQAGLLGLTRGISLLPLSALLWVGRRLGDLAYWILPARRAVARQNLDRAFRAEQRPRELDRLCRESFRHFGMTLVEACTLLVLPPSRLLSRVDVEGVDHLRAAASRGRGILILTAHLGNWELLGATHVKTGVSLTVVARPLDSPALDRLVNRLRTRSGITVIPKRQAFRGAREALRRGSMVAILLDQNAARHEGEFVPFFGELACTSKSLALLALWSGAPVVPVFIRRENGGRHRVTFEPAVPPPTTGNREQDTLAYTAAFARIVEARVRQSAEQWLWMHRRWKTRPRSPASAPADARGGTSAAPTSREG